ncbi:MAG TPA: hypothetical protein VM511_02135, partial [Luteolibacter sp.]|nr:hypothetical protein [Luteolibacter sp.]
PLFALMDLEGDPGTACRGCGLAAKSWWLMHYPDAARLAVPLGFHEQGKFGVAAFQFFSLRETSGVDIRTFYFEKSKNGWLLIPGMRLTNSPTESQIALRDWADDRTRGWKDKWQGIVLQSNPRLDAIGDGKAPAVDEARALVGKWLSATHGNDVDSMLGMVALSNLPGEEPRTLRSIGYEISTASRDAGRYSVIFSEQGKTWTTVGVKSQAGGSATYPLYLIVPTSSGLRLLIAADLFGDATPGRDRLNEAVLGRLEGISSAEAIIELRGMIARFREAIPR